MINQNLGAFDIAVLERFLRSDHAPEDCATIPEMDGVLTAVAIGPDIILPGEWLAALWGEESPIFGSNEEAGAVIGALMARYNEIIRTLDADPPAYAPILGEGGASDKAHDWSYGFMVGIGLREKAWRPLFRSRRHSQALFPILTHLKDFQEDPDFEAQEGAEFKLQAVELIPAAVLLIYDYWKAKRTRRPSGGVHLVEMPIRVRP